MIHDAVLVSAQSGQSYHACLLDMDSEHISWPSSNVCSHPVQSLLMRRHHAGKHDNILVQYCVYLPAGTVMLLPAQSHLSCHLQSLYG